jgi:hypothetical protein
MEALVPADVLEAGNGDNHTARSYTLLEHGIDHTARSSNSAVPTTNYDAIAAAAAVSLERRAAYLPQSRSSFARTAPTTDDGGQWAPGQRATSGQRATLRQRATSRQTSRWMSTLTAIGGSLSSNMKLWLDFAILSIEHLLNMLHTISTAYREPANVGSNASTAAAAAPNGENGLIDSLATAV